MARASRPRSPSTRSIASGGPLGLQPHRSGDLQAVERSLLRGDVEGREETGRAVALVVVAAAGSACPGSLCRRRRAGNDPRPWTVPSPSSPTQRTRAGGSGGSHDYKRHGTTSLFAALDIATKERSLDSKCFPRHAAASREFRQIRSTSSRANVACSPSTSSDRSNGTTYGDVSSRRQPDRFRDWRHRRFDAPRWQAGFVVQTHQRPPGSYQVDATCPRCPGSPRPTNGDQALVRPTLPPPPRTLRARHASPCDVHRRRRNQNLQTLQMRLVIRSMTSSPPLSAVNRAS